MTAILSSSCIQHTEQYSQPWCSQFRVLFLAKINPCCVPWRYIHVPKRISQDPSRCHKERGWGVNCRQMSLPSLNLLISDLDDYQSTPSCHYHVPHYYKHFYSNHSLIHASSHRECLNFSLIPRLTWHYNPGLTWPGWTRPWPNIDFPYPAYPV
jgi:hypothetical protein